MEALAMKIDLLVESSEKIQADVKETKDLLKNQAEKQKALEDKLGFIEKSITKDQSKERVKNVLLFSVAEKKESNRSLLERIRAIFISVEIDIPEVAILDLFRIGKWEEGKCRPICLKLIAERYKYHIFEKSAELRKLEIGVDSDVQKQDRALRNKALKARYLLRQQGKAPYMRGINLFLDKRRLTEQELDGIINDEEGEEGPVDTASLTSSQSRGSAQQNQIINTKQKRQHGLKAKSSDGSQKKLEKFAFLPAGAVTRNSVKQK